MKHHRLRGLIQQSQYKGTGGDSGASGGQLINCPQSEECLAFVGETCLPQEPHLLPLIHLQSHALSSPERKSHQRED